MIGGFVAAHGYGGEEWNNVSKRSWRGNRIFHTETSDKLDAYAAYSHLGLIMTAMREDAQYIVGVACGVSRIDDQEATKIGKLIDLDAIGHETWAIDSVKSRFRNRSDFNSHWKAGLHTISWQCPEHLFHWFLHPVALPKYPLRSDKMVLAKMHNGYQAIRPEDGLKLLGVSLPTAHPIREWLINNEFDEAFLIPKTRNQSKPLSPSQRRKEFSSPAAVDPYYRYIRERLISVDPAHGLMEKQFHNYLRQIGVKDLKTNQAGIDALFTHPRGDLCLAELKPTHEGETRFAIRMAVGQVLEYRHFVQPGSQPLIVTTSKPSEGERRFLRDLKIACSWMDSNGGFQFEWP